MPICDRFTTDASYGCVESGCTRRKALYSMEPKRGIEPLTYALRVQFLRKLVESGRYTSNTDMDLMCSFGTKWSVAEASEFTTELTTHSDIHLKPATLRLLSRNSYLFGHTLEVIAPCVVPWYFLPNVNSCAAVVPKWSTIFVGQWTNTLASLFGFRLKSSERWTFSRESVDALGVKLSVKQLTSTSQPNSALVTIQKISQVVDVLSGGFVLTC